MALTDSWTLTASHEWLEMLADPFSDRMVPGPSKKRGEGRLATSSKCATQSSAHPGLVRNQGKVNAVIYATHIIPTKTTEEGFRIDDPQPKNCNVK